MRLIGKLQSISAWFGTAGQVVIWFRKRRGVRFERVDGPGGPRVRLCYEGDEIQQPLKVRVYGPQGRPHVDIPWNGEVSGGLDLDIASWPGNLSPDAALSSGS